jgi:hypothetical protein
MSSHSLSYGFKLKQNSALHQSQVATCLLPYMLASSIAS